MCIGRPVVAILGHGCKGDNLSFFGSYSLNDVIRAFECKKRLEYCSPFGGQAFVRKQFFLGFSGLIFTGFNKFTFCVASNEFNIDIGGLSEPLVARLGCRR